MIFKSKPTARGNVGVSHNSQAEADAQAESMDAGGFQQIGVEGDLE